MQTIDEDIRTGKFHSAYLLFGEETYLKNLYKKKIRNAVLPEDDPVNFTVFSGREIDVRQVIDQAETLPFFSDHRLILIEDSGLFQSGSAELSGYLAELPPETILLFVEEKVDKRSKLYKAVVKYGHAAEFRRQNEKTLRAWILGRVKKSGKKIRTDAYTLFREKTGDDMSTIEQELEKLLSYTLDQEEITCADVEAVCTQTPEDKIFDMIRAMAEQRQKEALDLYYDLLAQKEPPMRILFLIARQFNQLLQVRDLQGQGKSRQEMAERMDLREFVVGRLVNQASRYSGDDLRQAVEDCVGAEESVKTGKLSDRLAVEMLIVRYSTRQSP